MADDVFGGLLGDMKELAAKLKEEDEQEDAAIAARVAEEEQDTASQLSKKIEGLGSLGAKKSKKPITDAFLKAISPDEVALLVAKHVRAGKEWAVKLYVQYIQTPETLNRLAGSEDEPVKFDFLLQTAKAMGLDMTELEEYAKERLKENWSQGDAIGSVDS